MMNNQIGVLAHKSQKRTKRDALFVNSEHSIFLAVRSSTIFASSFSAYLIRSAQWFQISIGHLYLSSRCGLYRQVS